MSEALWAKIRDLERRNRAIESADLTADELLSSAMLLSLPGLRGAWPMSSFDENGDAFDLSGQGRVLTYNGNPTYNYDALVPYIDFDGTGDFLSRADEAGLDILGTEAYVNAAARGLTFGGWFYVDVWDAAVTPFMAKWQAPNQLSYLLAAVGAGNPQMFITTDGFTQITVISTVPRTTAGWMFLVGRFVPSAELSIFVNDTETLNAAGIPASIFNSTSRFSIGEEAVDGVFLDGRASLCFLCAAALSDAIIMSLFHQTRAIFRV